MISLVLTPLEVGKRPLLPVDVISYGVLAGRELLVGVLVGVAVSAIFVGIQMGSRLVGIQIGFGLGGAINPLSGVDSGTVDMFYSILATVIFLSANGHSGVLAALVRTFDLAPLGDAALPPVNPVQVIALIQSVFEVALRIAMPAIAAMLLADVGLGLVGRAAPQMQVIVVGVPVKVGLGLLILAVSTPTTATLMDATFRTIGRSATSLIGG